jgi:hypothetical protein
VPLTKHTPRPVSPLHRINVPPDSTKKIYLHGLVGSIVNLVVVSLYALLVVRLSLDYLGKQEFGLLSLVTQISTYIAVIDLGLFTAFSRILIDYTTGTKAHYANALKTASRIFHILGLMGFLVACGVAFAGRNFLSIPDHLHREFTFLMLAQGITLFFMFSLKPITAPLVANGKHYYIFWLSSGMAILNSLVFWFAIRGGVGIYSSLLANSICLAIHSVCLWRLARPYIDAGIIRGRYDSSIFKEVAAFARDTMIWQIGGQTLISLPIILASAWFALGATANISGGMKLIMLMISICTRFGDMAVTPLSIEFAKGNEAGAASKMTRIAGLSGTISACAAILIICVNPAFIHWWMLDKISWSWHENLAAALWIAILSVTQCMYGYAVVSRRLNIIRWALLSECLLYVALAYSLRPFVHSAALLWAKPIATLLLTIAVGWQISKHTGFDALKLFPIFLRQFLALSILFPLCFWALRILQSFDLPPFGLFLAACLLGLGATLLAIPLLTSREMRADLTRMISRILNRNSPAKPILTE